jgi:hypothetical protein
MTLRELTLKNIFYKSFLRKSKLLNGSFKQRTSWLYVGINHMLRVAF